MQEVFVAHLDNLKHQLLVIEVSGFKCGRGLVIVLVDFPYWRQTRHHHYHTVSVCVISHTSQCVILHGFVA